MYDDAEGQRRSDGHTIFKIDCMSECLHELCVSYINILNDDCIMRDEVELWGVVWYYFIGNNQHYEILGIKIGFKMDILGHQSDNLHPYRVGLIDKRLYLDAEAATNW